MSNKNLSVQSVKFRIPSPRKLYILRNTPMTKLGEMTENKLTIIKAGAGGGKTTLLSVYIKEHNIDNVRWITIDDTMNQVFLFWNYVFEALKDYITDKSDSLSKCFDSNMNKDMLEQLVTALAYKINTDNDIYLALDDFQYIENDYLLETINLFIKEIPDNLHIIIMTRTMPKLDTGMLYMNNQLVLIDENDMKLTDEECRKFLVDTLGQKIDNDKLVKIIENANGWIGGAQLLAISENIDGNNIIANSDINIIYDYIKKEIYDNLSDEEQMFLKKTAVLNYFNEKICELYLPEYNFEHLIKSITDKNLFVIVIGEEKKEYRYHAILRDFLLYVLDKDKEEKSKLYTKAADVMYKIQDYGECVRLLSQNKSYELLMTRLLKMPQNVVTFTYMMQVPLEEIIKNSNFAYQYFFCYYASLDLLYCKKIYTYIKENLHDDETFSAFHNANLFFDINWEVKNVSVLSIEQIEEMPLNQVSKAYLLIKEAYFLFVADDIINAMFYLEKAESIYKISKNIYIESFVLAEKTQILEEVGEFSKAFDLYKKMYDIIKEMPAMKSTYYIGISGLHIRQLRLDKASEELKIADKLVDDNLESVNSAYTYTLAEWYYINGDCKKTEEIIKSLTGTILYSSFYFQVRFLRYPFYRHNHKDAAIDFISKYKRDKEVMKTSDIKLLYITVQYEYGDKKQACEDIDNMLAAERKSGNKFKITECALTKARFLYEQKDKDVRVINLIKESLEYAIPELIKTPFYYEKEFVIKILQDKKELLKKELTDKQFDFLVDSYKPVKEQINNIEQKNTSSLMELTDREMEVLNEIKKGSTNKQIADNLCISLATVKTHLINIYSKLGVNNRVSAIEKIK